MKTPLVPDSEMYMESSTSTFAGDERKAGSDALSAPHAREIATSDADIGLTEEGQTRLVVSAASVGFPENEEDIVFIYNPADKERWSLAYDTATDDFKALDDAVARFYKPGSPEYITLHGRLKQRQVGFGKRVGCGKLRVEARFNKTGRVVVSSCDMIE